MMFILRRPVRCVCAPFANAANARCSSATSSESADGIVIPKYIPRSPTDILEALNTTVKRDFSAPHYKFHDDPYLYPTSTYKKRTYALSQESGRKAAHWIRQEHAEYFIYRESDPPERTRFPYENADPPIAAYIPRAVYNEESDVTEEDLRTVIRSNLLNDAITVYNLLKAKNPDGIGAGVQQEFLEMLCFFNETEPISEEWLEEKWFLDNSKDNQQPKWKKDGLATKIFSEMGEKTPEAYCSMIGGMCKHRMPEEAFNLYNECRQAGMVLTTTTYNYLITAVPYLKETIELRWQMIQELLNDMNSQGLSPNVITLNNILYCLQVSGSPLAKEYSLNVIAEFVKECEVEPSLASWSYLLDIFYNERNSKNDILHTIMKKLSGQSLEARDPRDVLFFSNAMHKCRYNLHDLQLANQLHNLLLHGSNYDLIGDSVKESSYYRYYFTLMMHSASAETCLEFYNTYVPHVYIPESRVMLEVIRMVDINGMCDFYAQLWSHLTMFRLSKNEEVVQTFLDSMVRNLPPEKMAKEGESSSEKPAQSDSPADSLGMLSLSALSVEENFGRIATEMWNQVKEDLEMTGRFMWKANMLNDMLMLLTRANKLNMAHDVVTCLLKSGGSFGVPSTSEYLVYFSTKALEAGFPSYTVSALKYLSECGFPETEEVCKTSLQKFLNRPEGDIEDLIKYAISVETVEMDSRIVSDLVSIVKAKNVRHLSSADQTSSTSSDSSSSSSDSDSDEEPENDFEEPKK